MRYFWELSWLRQEPLKRKSGLGLESELGRSTQVPLMPGRLTSGRPRPVNMATMTILRMRARLTATTARAISRAVYSLARARGSTDTMADEDITAAAISTVATDFMARVGGAVRANGTAANSAVARAFMEKVDSAEVRVSTVGVNSTEVKAAMEAADPGVAKAIAAAGPMAVADFMEGASPTAEGVASR